MIEEVVAWKMRIITVSLNVLQYNNGQSYSAIDKKFIFLFIFFLDVTFGVHFTWLSTFSYKWEIHTEIQQRTRKTLIKYKIQCPLQSY